MDLVLNFIIVQVEKRLCEIEQKQFVIYTVLENLLEQNKVCNGIESIILRNSNYESVCLKTGVFVVVATRFREMLCYSCEEQRGARSEKSNGTNKKQKTKKRKREITERESPAGRSGDNHGVTIKSDCIKIHGPGVPSSAGPQGIKMKPVRFQRQIHSQLELKKQADRSTRRILWIDWIAITYVHSLCCVDIQLDINYAKIRHTRNGINSELVLLPKESKKKGINSELKEQFAT
ncbi:hypothetical protein WN51_01462 [Melipona quadrifasciata]|uniref:Uncharacterized protein n=1 Tax=Melipona quadrifasciata TaxID=166423 RepID=A0A0M8ZYS6_9HYME|nr:hypothetical protein WN51_01462 [Melipona quadrifasciata]